MAGPKPEYSSIALEWGDDDNYIVTGAPGQESIDGTPVKIEPALGVIKQGGRPQRQQPAQYLNWVLNQFGKVAKALIGHIMEVDERVEAVEEFIYAPPAESDLYTFEGPMEWRCPPNCYRVRLRGCGGGGGGAGGMYGSNQPNVAACGGAGGAGAVECVVEVDVSPGTVYEVLIGQGGKGGARGVYATATLPEPGGNGGDTIFREKSTGKVLARFPGAQGGRQAIEFVRVDEDPPRYMIVPGGATVSMVRLVDYSHWPYSTLCTAPQFGGDGRHRNHPEDENPSPVCHGAGSPQGYSGGQMGSNGRHSGFFVGGAGGGGGGAGPYGNGISGSSGGDANQSGAGHNGIIVIGVIPMNTGAGGGGGGSGGAGGAGGGGNGAPGRHGSAGRLLLTPIFDGR